jgi:hypothetical protein
MTQGSERPTEPEEKGKLIPSKNPDHIAELPFSVPYPIVRGVEGETDDSIDEEPAVPFPSLVDVKGVNYEKTKQQ